MVGEFALAYPEYFTAITSNTQDEWLIFYTIMGLYIKLIHGLHTVIHIFNRGRVNMCITDTPILMISISTFYNPFMVVENSVLEV